MRRKFHRADSHQLTRPVVPSAYSPTFRVNQFQDSAARHLLDSTSNYSTVFCFPIAAQMALFLPLSA